MCVNSLLEGIVYLVQDFIYKSDLIESEILRIIVEDKAPHVCIGFGLSFYMFFENPFDFLLDIFFVKVFNVRLNKLQSICHFSNLSDLEVISLVISIENVVLDGHVEEEWFLHDNTDLSS